MVSVIVVAYNAEKYLKACLESIKRQSYEDFELIFVDDGSSDRTGEIAKKWAAKDSRIRFFAQNNSGVSKARNFAMDQSKGEYLAFIDADDVVEKDFIQQMVMMLERETADCAVVGRASFSGKRFPEVGVDRLINCTGKGLLNEIFSDLGGFVTDKLYRHSIIEKYMIRFNESIAVMEDMLFNIAYFQYSKKVCFNPAVRYFYRQHSESAYNNILNINWFSILDAYGLIIQKCGINYDEIIYCYLMVLYEASYRMLKVEGISESLKEKIYREIKFMESKKIRFHWKNRIKLFLFKYCPTLVMIYKRRMLKSEYK